MLHMRGVSLYALKTCRVRLCAYASILKPYAMTRAYAPAVLKPYAMIGAYALTVLKPYAKLRAYALGP